MHSAERECTLTGNAVHSAKLDNLVKSRLFLKSRKLKSDANNKYREHNMTRKLSE